jgi:hypothetical protein
MREVFPGGVKQQSRAEGRGSRAWSARRVLLSTLATRRLPLGEPRLKILLKALLCFEVVHDHDNGSLGEKVMQQSGKKRLGRSVNTGTSQCAARLQSPGEGVHGGSLRNSVEQRACRRDVRILRQARGRLQAGPRASSVATTYCRAYASKAKGRIGGRRGRKEALSCLPLMPPKARGLSSRACGNKKSRLLRVGLALIQPR